MKTPGGLGRYQQGKGARGLLSLVLATSLVLGCTESTSPTVEAPPETTGTPISVPTAEHTQASTAPTLPPVLSPLLIGDAPSISDSSPIALGDWGDTGTGWDVGVIFIYADEPQDRSRRGFELAPGTRVMEARIRLARLEAPSLSAPYALTAYPPSLALVDEGGVVYGAIDGDMRFLGTRVTATLFGDTPLCEGFQFLRDLAEQGTGLPVEVVTVESDVCWVVPADRASELSMVVVGSDLGMGIYTDIPSTSPRWLLSEPD